MKGKDILNTLRNKGLLTDKEAFEKQYKKIEERLRKEVEKLKEENNKRFKKR